MQTSQDQVGTQRDEQNGPAAKVAIYDRSHWGRIQIKDRDRLSFLHNQTTNDLNRLRLGQSCDTVLLTATARTLDLLSVYITEDDILVLTSPQRRTENLAWLDRYIFFGDKVQLTDVTEQTACFSLIGPHSSELLRQRGVDALPASGTHHVVTLANVSVRLAYGSGLSGTGYTLIAEAQDGKALWQSLCEAGSVALNDQDWEQLRIRDGRPVPGAELTEDYNPLEVGLWDTISFNKGCYIGQETIARLNTYSGVKQRLWGFQLSKPGTLGEPIYGIEPETVTQKVGLLTSVSADGQFGLGYLKTKAGGEGSKVKIGEAIATAVAVPFLSRQTETSEQTAQTVSNSI
jgi:tRNA-modifying protein YgfZ